MFGTVRTRILLFAFLSVFALAGLAALSWSIILKAEDASRTLIRNNLNEAWLLADLEQDHRHLQDLAYKIKAQLMLWDEIETEFSRLEAALPAHWQKLEMHQGLSSWTEEHSEDFGRVVALMARMKEGIAEKSYYRVGQVVDFDLFPAMEPMLDAIAERQFQSRNSVSGGADELLSFLAGQQNFLIAGSVSFLLIVIAMTWWLRQSVILRLQGMESDLVAMEKNADLTRVPVLKGRDEVAGVARALGGLVSRFEHFIADIRSAVALQRDEIGRVGRRSTALDESADFLIETVEQTRTISEALRQESVSMRQLIARFRTAAEPSS